MARVKMLGMCAAGLMVVAGSAWAQPAAAPQEAQQESAEKLPTGREVVERYVKATGGEEAYKAIKSQRVVAVMKIPAQGMEMTSTAVFKAPGKAVTTVEIPGLGTIVQGTDGKRVWTSSMLEGSRLLEGKEAEAQKRMADVREPLQLDKWFESVTTEGIEEVEGSPAYRVKFVTKSGVEETRWYNVESGYMVQSESTQFSNGAPITVRTTFSDYRKVGDLRISHKQTAMMMGMEMIAEVQEVEINPEISDDELAPNDEVKALIEEAEREAEAEDEGA